MIEIPQGNSWKDPGVWKGVRRVDGTRSASISCPKCGQPASLSDHTIADDGTVPPSLVCPYDGCEFHDYVTLKDWNPSPAAPLTPPAKYS